MRLAAGRLGFFVSVVLATGAAACGGDSTGDDDDDQNSRSSGIPGDKLLSDLTPDELLTLCEWIIPREGGPGPTDCNGTTIIIQTPEECAASNWEYQCTVAAAEACVNSANGDPCLLFSTPECLAYIRCASAP